MTTVRRATGAGVAAALGKDSFNYPVPNRRDTMTLQTITANQD